MRNIFTKLFAVLAMSVMTVAVWGGDAPSSPGTTETIPTTLSNYFDFNHATFTGSGNVENSGKNCGSTGSNTVISFNIDNTIAQEYYLTMRTAFRDGSSRLQLTIKQGSTEIFQTVRDVLQTSEYYLSDDRYPTLHVFQVGFLPAGSLTLELKVLSTTHSAAGNYGWLAIHSLNQVKAPTAINLNTGIHGTDGGQLPRYEDANQNIGYLKKNGYSIFHMYNAEDNALYDMLMDIKYNGNAGDMRVKIYDLSDLNTIEAEGYYEISSGNTSTYATQIFPISTPISKGLKRVRLEYTNNDNGWFMNYNNLRFVKCPTNLSFLGFEEANPVTFPQNVESDVTATWRRSGGNIRDDANRGIKMQNGWSVTINVPEDSYIASVVFVDAINGTINANVGSTSGTTFQLTVTDRDGTDVERNLVESSKVEEAEWTCGEVRESELTFTQGGDGSVYINTIRVIYLKRTDLTRYVRPFAHMNLNTLCFPYQIDSYTGATFYTIQETDVDGEGQLTKLVLESVDPEAPLSAGTPYFYDPIPGEDKLVCNYSGSSTSIQEGAGGLTGRYADNCLIPVGSYVTVNNQLYKCGANVTLAEYRAYVTPVAYSRAAVPGRRRLTIGGKNAPTDVENVQSDNVQSTKVLRNGQLFIIRDGKTYNAMGQKLR